MDILASELMDESGVFTPEKTNVRNLVEFHSQPLQTDAEGPSGFSLNATICQNLLFYDATAEDFQPFTLVHDFQLPRGVGERKIGLYKAMLQI